MRYLTKNLFIIFSFTLILLTIGCGGSPASSGSSGSTGTSGGSGNTSQSGSTAAMLAYEDVLYILQRYQLQIFDISSKEETTLVRAVTLNSAETLFIYDGYLYVGGNNGVEILEIGDPFYPVKVSTYAHLRGCDPVVVTSGIGYVTLRNRPGCGGDVNRLEVVDFTDPLRPKLIETFNMDFPYGLAKTEDYLAICQSEYGLSLLDVNVIEQDGLKTADISEKIRFFDVNCFDAIATEKSLITTAEDGIYQFEIDNLSIEMLSKIPVGEDPSQTSNVL